MSPDGIVRSTGYNGLPRGIEDTPERLNNREIKLKLTVHAEVNAILNAARSGVSTLGCTLYLAATDDTGAVWGGPPCSRCCLDVIQAGIASVRSIPFKGGQSAWAEDVGLGGHLLGEAGVLYTELVGGAIPSVW